MPFSGYDQAREYLYGLKHRGAIYGVDRMGHFTQRIGNPQLKYPVIHLAGTNGKGSTCAMVESIFRSAGYKTGLFTSPHLIHQGERVQINRNILSHQQIVEYTNKLRPVAESIEKEFPDHHPTFFEFMTGMAFLRFAEAEVDVGIIETGLGGRLDATNVVQPEVCAITSISLDHTEILGDSLEKIAAEKAGIFKKNVPVVLGILPEVAEKVLREKARALNCPIYSIKETFGEDLSHFPETSLPGDYQRRNAALATLVCQVLEEKFSISKHAILKGLNEVHWPGRWDRQMIGKRTIILDATHNPEGAYELQKNLRQLVDQVGIKPVVLAGTLGEARAKSLMSAIAEFAEVIYLLQPHQPRACSIETLRGYIPESFNGSVREGSVRKLFPAAGVTTIPYPNHPIVATGSIYLIGEIMDALYHDIPVEEQSLQD